MNSRRRIHPSSYLIERRESESTADNHRPKGWSRSEPLGGGERVIGTGAS